MTTHLIRSGVAAGLLAASLVAVAAPATAEPHGKVRGYSAEIRRASYGVPHITSRSFASLGFGVGHVQAEDNICVIAERVVTADGKRSRYFGATDANIRSDLFFRKAKADRVVEHLLAGRPDGIDAPSRQARELIRGFAAGYNAYLRRTGVANLTDPKCTGQPWVRKINEFDVWRMTWASLIRASSRALLDGIVAAAPPATTGATAGAAPE